MTGLAALGGLAAAPLAAHGIDGGIADEFGAHQAGDKQLPAVIIEIDSGALDVRFGYDAKAVLGMSDLLSVR